MKRLYISLLVVAACTVRAQQGGTVVFGNNSSSKVTVGQGGPPVKASDNVQAALYWAPTDPSSFAQIGAAVSVGVVNVQSQAVLVDGIFVGGIRTTNLATAGNPAYFQVRAWSGGYATYEQAATNANALLGQSVVFQVTTGNAGSPPTPPAALTGPNCLQGFALAPNPGSTASAGGNQTICAGSSTAALGGSVGGGATGGIWSSSGTGTFLPNATTLNATYGPSPADITAGTVTLTLTSTGPVPSATAQVVVSINAAAAASAGGNQTICAGSSTAALGGSVSGGATGGLWSSSGTGTFLPNATTLNATYNPSPTDITAATVTLTLTSTGQLAPCGPATAQVLVTIHAAATATSGGNQTIWAGSSTVALGGSVGGGATGGLWSSSGNGNFSPNATTLGATYTPSPEDVTAGMVTLTLTSTGQLAPCGAATAQVVVTIDSTSGVPITFQVDMGYQINLGQFNADGTDHIEVQSGFNSSGTWGGHELTKVPGTTLYQNSFAITSPSPGNIVEYKFHISGTHETWENLGWYPNGNRRFMLTSSAETLPTAYFNDAWAGNPGIAVTVQVDMSAQVGAGNFVPGPDTVEAQGAFNNAWSAFPLTNDPSASNPNLYSGTYVETVRAPGTRIEYKFHTYGTHDFWESIVGYPDNNRSFILSDVSPQVLPAVYFGDTSGYPIKAGVYFQLDLSSQIVINAFNPTQDIASVRGDAMGWGDPPGSGLQLLADTSRPGIYTNTWLTTSQLTGAVFLYKNTFFRTNPPYAVWEIGDNKSVTFTGSEPVNADGYHMVTVGPTLFDDFYANPNDYLAADTLVTFSVNMTNAVGTDSHTFDPSTDSVYMNGDFLGWPAWDTSLPQLANDPVGSRIYQIQRTIPKGNPVLLTYKYSINGSDNEAGFAVNHVRYVRQMGVYSLPLDTFGTMLQETASLPTVSVNSAAICTGSSSALTATTSASSPSFLWSPGGATTPSITVSPSSTTTYTVMVTDGTTGCVNSGSGTVTINPAPTAAAGSNQIVCTNNPKVIGGSPTASGGTGPYTYSWSPVTGLDNPAAPNPTATVSSNTTYTVTVTDAKGCTGTASVVLTVTPRLSHRFYRVELVPSVKLSPVTVAPSFIVITSISVSGTSVAVVWTAAAGGTYRLQYKNNLTDATWTDVPGDVIASGPTATKTNVIPGGGCP
jgi:hypothetical protein